MKKFSTNSKIIVATLDCDNLIVSLCKLILLKRRKPFGGEYYIFYFLGFFLWLIQKYFKNKRYATNGYINCMYVTAFKTSRHCDIRRPG